MIGLAALTIEKTHHSVLSYRVCDVAERGFNSEPVCKMHRAGHRGGQRVSP